MRDLKRTDRPGAYNLVFLAGISAGYDTGASGLALAAGRFSSRGRNFQLLSADLEVGRFGLQ
jgi:hypothetical protein